MSPVKTSKIAIILVVFSTILIAILLARYMQQGDTLHYSGNIDQEFLDRVKNFPAKKIDHIVIDSIGGEYPIALEVAGIIQENKIQIIVNGYCLSACASILLPAGRNNVVKEYSLIGFHNLPGMWFYVDRYTNNKYDISIKNEDIYDDSLRTLEIYKKSKINPEIFIALTLAKEPICLEITEIQREEASVKKLSITFSNDLYVPNRAFFSQFNWNFEELYLPQTKEIAEKLAEPLRKHNPELKLKIADEEFKFPDFFSEGGMEFTHFEEC